MSLHIPSGPVVNVDESFGASKVGAILCATSHVRGDAELEHLFAETLTLLMGSVALPHTKLGGADKAVYSATEASGVLGDLTDMGCMPAHAALRGAPALALVGHFVRLTGLAKRADLNGTRARVIRYNASSGLGALPPLPNHPAPKFCRILAFGRPHANVFWTSVPAHITQPVEKGFSVRIPIQQGKVC
jgi:hypothetical protein